MVTLARSVNIQKPPVAGILAYLLVSFVLSVISFVVVIVGLTLGVGMLILWIGLPLLIGTLAFVRGVGVIERSMARHLLGIAIAEPQVRRHERGILRGMLASLADPQVWMNLLYIVLKVPISLVVLLVAGGCVRPYLG